MKEDFIDELPVGNEEIVNRVDCNERCKHKHESQTFKMLARVSKDFQTFEIETSITLPIAFSFEHAVQQNKELDNLAKSLYTDAYRHLNDMIELRDKPMPKKSWEELLNTPTAIFAKNGKEAKSSDWKEIPQGIYELFKKGAKGKPTWTTSYDEVLQIAKEQYDKL